MLNLQQSNMDILHSRELKIGEKTFTYDEVELFTTRPHKIESLQIFGKKFDDTHHENESVVQKAKAIASSDSAEEAFKKLIQIDTSKYADTLKNIYQMNRENDTLKAHKLLQSDDRNAVELASIMLSDVGIPPRKIATQNRVAFLIRWIGKYANKNNLIKQEAYDAEDLVKQAMLSMDATAAGLSVIFIQIINQALNGKFTDEWEKKRNQLQPDEKRILEEIAGKTIQQNYDDLKPTNPSKLADWRSKKKKGYMKEYFALLKQKLKTQFNNIGKGGKRNGQFQVTIRFDQKSKQLVARQRLTSEADALRVVGGGRKDASSGSGGGGGSKDASSDSGDDVPIDLSTSAEASSLDTTREFRTPRGAGLKLSDLASDASTRRASQASTLPLSKVVM